MNIVKIALLRLVARNIQSLVDFITLLDQRFDDFVAEQEKVISTLNNHQSMVDQEYADATKKIADKLANAARDAQIAKNMKAALPTGTTAA